MLWFPKDNKFATALDVTIEATNEAIRRLNVEIAKTQEQLEVIRHKIFIFKNNLDNLTSTDTKCISLHEYKTIIKALSFARHEEITTGNLLIAHNQVLQAEQRKLADLEKNRAAVSFKLLEFKRK